MDFQRLIAALNDYVIAASKIVIAIRNLINCAALVQKTIHMSKSTHLLGTEHHTEILREEVWLALDRRARAAVVDTSVAHLWA